MTLGGSGASVMPLVEWKKPMILANYVLGGCAPWLTSTTKLLAANRPVVSVSTERDADLVAVARCFGSAKRLTAEQFAAEGWAAYRKTFGKAGDMKCPDDPLKVPSITDIQKQLAAKRILVVGTGKPGTEVEFFGAKAIYIGFDEFDALCKEVDTDAANAKAAQWMKAAEKIVEAQPEAIRASARVALGTRKLLAKYSSDNVTMNCLGGFRAGKLPAYPCLGFTELLDEGQHGVCEAQLPDAWAMALCRIMTGRAGFVSDPTLDTSTNHIIYAHCMAPTKMLGTDRPASPFRIRTLHNRDPRGACVQSFMPAGHVTTSFRIVGKNLVLHQAKSVGNYDSERGCRSQLVGDVKGDIEKLMRHWYAWHRVTVYGDVKEPLKELAAALKLGVIEEA
jgi:L-fucose isomerase-like protein